MGQLNGCKLVYGYLKWFRSKCASASACRATSKEATRATNKQRTTNERTTNERTNERRTTTTTTTTTTVHFIYLSLLVRCFVASLRRCVVGLSVVVAAVVVVVVVVPIVTAVFLCVRSAPTEGWTGVDDALVLTAAFADDAASRPTDGRWDFRWAASVMSEQEAIALDAIALDRAITPWSESPLLWVSRRAYRTHINACSRTSTARRSRGPVRDRHVRDVVTVMNRHSRRCFANCKENPRLWAMKRII